jgi:hypothetical protein
MSNLGGKAPDRVHRNPAGGEAPRIEGGGRRRGLKSCGPSRFQPAAGAFNTVVNVGVYAPKFVLAALGNCVPPEGDSRPGNAELLADCVFCPEYRY